MARFSVLSHETKSLFWESPRKWQSLVDSHHCHNRHEDGHLSGLRSSPGRLSVWPWFAGRRRTGPGSCSQEPGDSWGACAVQAQIASRRRLSIRPAEHSMWGELRSPRRPLPMLARLFKSRHRSLELQTARTQSEGHQCASPNVGRAKKGAFE